VQAEDFTYTTYNGTITIRKYIGPGGPVTIPSTINDLPVASIGGEAFQMCTSLTSVTIPDSVTNIGVAAFCDCSRLTNVMIGNSVTSIGGYAFSSCTNVTSIKVNVSNPAYS